MLRLVVFAIGIDDVRDIFGAEPGLASRLRQVAADRFGGGPPPAEAALVQADAARRPDTEVRTDRPLRTDVDTLLSGGYVAPTGSLLLAGPDGVAGGTVRRHVQVPWDADAFDAVEWDLARAGLNSDYSLRRLADRDLGPRCGCCPATRRATRRPSTWPRPSTRCGKPSPTRR
ncbi:hypothetical protein G7085_07190 [Tessaracoccus sp. HDW20]|uniref:hypothetical protein n=1 Tax=Tessaracoccus coleopterorum TaxID=2714950 RepID=UPI0018D4D930|nr:hypothetical protein [Tessaracoccus coleopterorum]NHB84461.1 hypothetical protein [Tessaracoccus coleopterorum]